MNTSMDNTYSVVIPAYQASAFIRDAVESVLQQTVPPAEIIVVDDGSTDETAAIAQSIAPLVTVVSTDNRGPGSATTTGVNMTRAPVVATLDADDRWKKTKMERQLELLSDNSQAPDLVFCKMSAFGATHLKSIDSEVSVYLRSSLVTRRSTFDQVGGMTDFEHRMGEFVDWLGRARAMGLQFGVVDELLVERRIHEQSLSFNLNSDSTRDFLAVARQALLRKKQHSA